MRQAQHQGSGLLVASSMGVQRHCVNVCRMTACMRLTYVRLHSCSGKIKVSVTVHTTCPDYGNQDSSLGSVLQAPCLGYDNQDCSLGTDLHMHGRLHFWAEGICCP